jgi:hypothetical protein
MAPSKKKASSEGSASPVKEAVSYAGIGVKEKEEMEFGGPIGVTALMIWSHYILLYFW